MPGQLLPAVGQNCGLLLLREGRYSFLRRNEAVAPLPEGLSTEMIDDLLQKKLLSLLSLLLQRTQCLADFAQMVGGMQEGGNRAAKLICCPLWRVVNQQFDAIVTLTRNEILSESHSSGVTPLVLRQIFPQSTGSNCWVRTDFSTKSR